NRRRDLGRSMDEQILARYLLQGCGPRRSRREWGRASNRGAGWRRRNRRIRNPHPLICGRDAVTQEFVSPVRILDDRRLRRVWRRIGLANVSRRRGVGGRRRNDDRGRPVWSAEGEDFSQRLG